MSKQRKLLARLCATPPPADFKWNELTSVLEHLGYELLRNSGSRRKFFHPESKALIICHEPHPAPSVDGACIVAVVSHLRKHGYIG